MVAIMNQEYLHQLFEYKDGNLYWRFTKGPRAVKGFLAGRVNPTTGYRDIRIDGKVYQFSRLVWVYHNGDIPENMQIDHISGNKLDNRIENLRCCTPQQNEWNKERCGVRFESGKWRARYTHNNQDKHIGMFDTEKKAKQAYFQTVGQIRNEYFRSAL